MSEAGSDSPPRLTPDKAAERWLNKLRVSKAESTVSGYRYQLRLFVQFCREEEIAYINELSGWDLETFETKRREAEIATITLANELTMLRQFLRYCERVDLVEDGLAETVVPPDVPAQDQVDETRIRPERANQLLEYHSNNDPGSRHHVLLAIAWFTGVRLGAMRDLDLEDVHLSDQYLEFRHRPDEDTPLKNDIDGERAVGFPEEVADAIREYINRDRRSVTDDYGRKPLITTVNGRIGRNTVRSSMYLATLPCLHSPCPHERDPETCEFTKAEHASKCPSSRSPHQVRTGSVTWQLNRGVPLEVVAERVNTSERVLKKHYDQPDMLEDFEQRRKHHIDRLSFDEYEGGDTS